MKLGTHRAVACDGCPAKCRAEIAPMGGVPPGHCVAPSYSVGTKAPWTDEGQSRTPAHVDVESEPATDPPYHRGRTPGGVRLLACTACGDGSGCLLETSAPVESLRCLCFTVMGTVKAVWRNVRV